MNSYIALSIFNVMLSVISIILLSVVVYSLWINKKLFININKENIEYKPFIEQLINNENMFDETLLSFI